MSDSWIGREITLLVKGQKLVGKVTKVSSRTGKLKIQTGPYTDWDVHPSLVKDGVVTSTNSGHGTSTRPGAAS